MQGICWGGQRTGHRLPCRHLHEEDRVAMMQMLGEEATASWLLPAEGNGGREATLFIASKKTNKLFCFKKPKTEKKKEKKKNETISLPAAEGVIRAILHGHGDKGKVPSGPPPSSLQTAGNRAGPALRHQAVLTIVWFCA
jgi:hypothetical protein